MQRPLIFEHRCLRNISQILQESFFAISEVQLRVLDHRAPSIEQAVILPSQMEHVLCMPTDRLPRLTLFCETFGRSITSGICMKF